MSPQRSLTISEQRPLDGLAPARPQHTSEVPFDLRRPDTTLANASFSHREPVAGGASLRPTDTSPATPPTPSPVLNKLLESPPLGTAIADRLPETFFTSTSLERWGDGALYRALGVPLFKDIVPTGGKALAKRMGKPLLSGNTDQERVQCLEAFERWSRGAEISHWIGLGAQGSLAAMCVAWGNSLLALAPLITTTLVDIYPIMLQRFNRIRLEDTLHALKARIQRRGEKAHEKA